MGQLTSRQEIISHEVNEPKMRNWLCANMALRETSHVISIFLHRRIAQIHRSMQTGLESSALCNINCSQRLERDGSHGWCTTCVRWADEIQNMCKPEFKEKVNFSRLNSSQWPVNPYEMARAFIPRAHRLYYKAAEFHEDLRFSLSLIENCVDFDVPRQTCERLWHQRGKLRRKNTRMRFTAQEMQGVVSALLELLAYLDIGSSADVVRLQDRLEAFQAGDIGDDDDDGCVVM